MSIESSYFGFYSYLFLTLIGISFLLGILNLTEDIIIFYFPFLEIYIENLFENRASVWYSSSTELKVPWKKNTTALLGLTGPPRDLPTSKVYVEFHAESDFEGPRAVRGHSMTILLILLIFWGNL